MVNFESVDDTGIVEIFVKFLVDLFRSYLVLKEIQCGLKLIVILVIIFPQNFFTDYNKYNRFLHAQGLPDIDTLIHFHVFTINFCLHFCNH